MSDTAFWVASHRAHEGEREDALFRDPLASVLAGEKGRRIAASIPGSRTLQFIMTVRTTAIDRLVLSAIDHGVDTVLNLGAGLDTRPYRMNVPLSLNWIEADFPELIEYKNEKLAAERPVCSLERVAIDLADRDARRALLDRVGATSRQVLVITEGVIIYLSDDEVARLAEDLRAVASVRYWIQDYYAYEARKHRQRVRNKLRAAPFLFSAPDWFGFFARYGFTPLQTISTREEALRVHRRPPLISVMTPLMWNISAKWRARADGMIGYTLLQREP